MQRSVLTDRWSEAGAKTMSLTVHMACPAERHANFFFV